MQTTNFLHAFIGKMRLFYYLHFHVFHLCTITFIFTYFIVICFILLILLFVQLTDPASITSTTPITSTKSWIKQTVTLKCVTDGVPIPTITWQKPDGSKTTQITAKESILSLEMKVDRDFGNYTCKADNDVGAAAKRIVQVNQISKWVPHEGLLFL